MIKIYSSKSRELALLPFLAEFRVRAFISYPIKGVTRKARGKKRGAMYRVVNFPIN